jgi:hypothetical protein
MVDNFQPQIISKLQVIQFYKLALTNSEIDVIEEMQRVQNPAC